MLTGEIQGRSCAQRQEKQCRATKRGVRTRYAGFPRPEQLRVHQYEHNGVAAEVYIKRVRAHGWRINKAVIERDTPGLMKLIGCSPEGAGVLLAGAHSRRNFSR